MSKVDRGYENTYINGRELAEQLMQMLDESRIINYNYYNCSFNYGDHGYAKNENQKENS